MFRVDGGIPASLGFLDWPLGDGWMLRGYMMGARGDALWIIDRFSQPSAVGAVRG